MYYVEKTKGTNYLKSFDYPLFVAVLLLSVIGLIALRSAIGETEITRTWLKQLIFVCVGSMMAIIVSAIDYKIFKTLGIAIYIGSIVLLVLVLFIGDKHYGSRSWLSVPLIGSFQPSELAKVAFAIIVPIFLERLKEGKDVGKNVIKLLIYAALPIILVLLQPDIGTAIVFIFAFVVLLFIYGIPYKYFFISLGALTMAAPIFWFFVLPKDSHIRHRIMTFIFPETDLLGKGMQVYNSKMTIGSGQLFGKGIFYNIQAKSSGLTSSYYVPFKQTDFIFSVIGEEVGFIGSMIVLALILFILFRSIYIAMNSRDAYGSFLVICITSMMGFHFIENIGMCIGILPVTGIPLPFVSQGNSSLISNFLNIGLLLSVSMRRKKAIFNSSQ